MIEGSRFLFVLGQPDQRFEHAMSCEELDLQLVQEPSFPAAAWQAPVASWVLSRIASELDENLATQLPAEQVCDGGGYFFPFVVSDSTGVAVAEFQLQGNTFGVPLLGSSKAENLSDSIVSEFMAILLRSPNEFAEICISVRDPEWELEPEEFDPVPTDETVNRYGWDGSVFLGAGNVWSEFDSGQPRPNNYRAYLSSCLAKFNFRTKC